MRDFLTVLISGHFHILTSRDFSFSDSKDSRADSFINYLHQHRSRIVNYACFQVEGISMGSGAIESMVKRIGRRIKISGA